MFLLRRTAARAVAAPSKLIFSKSRSIAAYSSLNFRVQQQQSVLPSLQRRFASDESARDQDEFSQTAAEAPVDEDVKPVEERSQEAALTDRFAEALEATTSPATRATDSVPKTNNLYIGNLFYEVSEEQLQRIFSRFGPLNRIKLVKDNRGLSRGFGYVDFENVADAVSAKESLDMQVFEGRNLVVQYLKQRSSPPAPRPGQINREPNPPSRTLFVGNMPFEMTDKDLNDLFREIRNVMDVRVAVDRRTGQPRGFAHADFLDVASATTAKELLDTKTIYGRRLRVDFSANTEKKRRSYFSDDDKRDSAEQDGKDT